MPASGGHKLFSGPGSVSRQQGMTKAQAEYRKFQVQTLSPVEKAYLETVKGLEKAAKKKSKEISKAFFPVRWLLSSAFLYI